MHIYDTTLHVQRMAKYIALQGLLCEWAWKYIISHAYTASSSFPSVIMLLMYNMVAAAPPLSIIKCIGKTFDGGHSCRVDMAQTENLGGGGTCAPSAGWSPSLSH